MSGQYHTEDEIARNFVTVDAARLLLIISRFSHKTDSIPNHVHCSAPHKIAGYFAPEYYLHKIDFLLRYPRYFVYELTELFSQGIIEEQKREELLNISRKIINTNEPELMTHHFRKFWFGAYDRIDDVEAWWYARELIYTGIERRGNSRPWKYYFITPRGFDEADRLVAEIPHTQWYADRILLIHNYFGDLSASMIKKLQYSHEAYREAELNEHIPDLSPEEIEKRFVEVFGEQLVLEIGA